MGYLIIFNVVAAAQFVGPGCTGLLQPSNSYYRGNRGAMMRASLWEGVRSANQHPPPTPKNMPATFIPQKCADACRTL